MPDLRRHTCLWFIQLIFASQFFTTRPCSLPAGELPILPITFEEKSDRKKRKRKEKKKNLLNLSALGLTAWTQGGGHSSRLCFAFIVQVQSTSSDWQLYRSHAKLPVHQELFEGNLRFRKVTWENVTDVGQNPCLVNSVRFCFWLWQKLLCRFLVLGLSCIPCQASQQHPPQTRNRWIKPRASNTLANRNKTNTLEFQHENEGWSPRRYEMGWEDVYFGEKGAKKLAALWHVSVTKQDFSEEVTDTWIPLPGNKILQIYQCQQLSWKQDGIISPSPQKGGTGKV